MELTKLSEYFELIYGRSHSIDYNETVNYLKKLELGAESSDNAISLLCQIGQFKFVNRLSEELLN